MATRLFFIPGSHPSTAAKLMLELKGVPYKRTDLVSPMHRPILRALGFPGITVPAIKHDGRKVQGTRAIAEFLDEIHPEPPLFPSDPAQRRAVDEAERWADSELQPVARRLTWWGMKRDKSGVGEFLSEAKLGLPTSVAAATAGPLIRLAARANKVTDASAREDLAKLPGLIDRVDEYIAAGTIGGDTVNVADLQIGCSVRLLMTYEDLRPSLEARPAGKHAMRVCPHFPGRVPPVMDDAERASALGAAA
jgi:glutathione S-transferase